MSRRCNATHSAGMNEAAPQTTPREPAASAANVSVSHPLRRTGTSPWRCISSVWRTASPPVSFSDDTPTRARSAARSTVRATPVIAGML